MVLANGRCIRCTHIITQHPYPGSLQTTNDRTADILSETGIGKPWNPTQCVTNIIGYLTIQDGTIKNCRGLRHFNYVSTQWGCRNPYLFQHIVFVIGALTGAIGSGIAVSRFLRT